jgi:peroxiredoxin
MSYAVPETDFDLEAELTRAREFYRNHAIPPEALAQMDRQTAELVSSGQLNSALSVGDQAVDFELPDAVGRAFRLGDALARGPVILTFYRGLWCPYCQIALRNLQQRLDEFREAGAELVAVSPQTPDHTLTTAERHELSFPVLSDEGASVAMAYGVAFNLPEYLSALYDRFDHPLSDFNGGHETLPVPATFVIDTEQVVRWSFVDPDYTRRADPDQILEVLRNLHG